MIESLQNFIITYQVLSVGFLGFSGVILTMITNEKNQTKQHSRQISHKSNAIRIAIKSELAAILQAYELRIKAYEGELKGIDTVIHNDPMDNVYKALLHDIGFLNEPEIEKIIQCYLFISNLPYQIRLKIDADNLEEIVTEDIKIRSHLQNEVIDLHKEMIPTIKESIEILNGNL